MTESQDVVASFFIREDKTYQIRDTIEKSSLFVPQSAYPLLLPQVFRTDITLDTVPSSSLGITFGCGLCCDVILPENPLISARHFSVGFDENRRLIVRDLSSQGTQLTYNGQAFGYHTGAQWILNDPAIFILGDEIELSIAKLIKFKINILMANTDDPMYIRAIDQFRAKCADHALQAVPLSTVPRNHAGVEISDVRTPTETCLTKVVGKGHSSHVSWCLNIQDGSEKAIKKPPGQNYDEERWDQEADILNRIDHPHAVRLIAYKRPFESPSPEIHLEYLRGGTLDTSRRSSPFSRKEIIVILLQCLSALVHLHDMSPPVCHRNIHPGNILVDERTEIGIFVKIGGFGRANIGSGPVTFDFNPIYPAPEIFTRGECTPLGDIWSLGLTVLGLLDQSLLSLMWSNERELYTALGDSGDSLKTYLLVHMLVQNPTGRSSARTCCEKLLHLWGIEASPPFPHDPHRSNPLEEVLPGLGEDSSVAGLFTLPIRGARRKQEPEDEGLQDRKRARVEN